ncbi:hypothetical protein HAX54_012738 [Datura stramonium]|uniref:Uncharacterized protein n=1 Tax=Datura stramonium TaxID=4076 RepID=A0ABS8TK86_DATST|nr:hypothetical protein [Datura stramonium]
MDSMDDSIPLAALNKGVRKWLFQSTKALASKIPCVAGPASRTRARRMIFEGPLTNPKTFRFASCQKNKWPDLPCPLKPLDIVCKFFGNPSRTSDSKVVIDVKQNHALPYGFLLIKVFGKLGVHFSSLKYYSIYDAMNYFETRGSHPEGGKGGSTAVAGTSRSHEVGEMEKLYLKIDHEQLKAQLVKNEETVVARHNDLMSLIRSLSPLTVSSPSATA